MSDHSQPEWFDALSLACAQTTKSIVGLYFSGKYCKYCKQFTPELIEAYPRLLDWDIDIVYVSSDKTVEQYDEYYGTHPWPSVPYNSKSARAALRSEFDVKTIPALLFFDTESKRLLCREGRSMIEAGYANVIATLIGQPSLEYDSEDTNF